MHLVSILTAVTVDHMRAAIRMHLRTDTSWVMSGRARMGQHGFLYLRLARSATWVCKTRFIPASLSLPLPSFITLALYPSLIFYFSLTLNLNLFRALHNFFHALSLLRSLFILCLLLCFSACLTLFSTLSLAPSSTVPLFLPMPMHRSGWTSDAHNTRHHGDSLSLDFWRAWWR